MSEDEVLAFAGNAAERARRAEVDLLQVAYQWALLHDRDRLDPGQSGRPGREQARRYGGDGVAEVSEFAAAELGARIGRSSYAAAQLIADAQDLCHRLPELWGRVRAGEVRASYARYVAQKTRHLSLSEAGYVDAAVAESADGRIPWARFEALVAGSVAAAAPALAREREAKARRAQFARRLRDEEGGMASFLVRADVATITQLDGAVTSLAKELAGSLPEADQDERRVRAVLLLANPGASPETPLADLNPRVQLYVHLSAEAIRKAEYDAGTGRAEPVARVEGHGPVTATWLRQVLGPTCRFTVRPVLDPLAQTPVDAYEIPVRHRRAVQIMTPADTFPFGSCTSRDMQVDHTEPHGRRGWSGIGNYGPMTTRHHRIKTHGGWQVRQPFPGIYVWRDRHGGFYLVDHTGTRPLRGPATRGHPPPTIIELHHQTPVHLELEQYAGDEFRAPRESV